MSELCLQFRNTLLKSDLSQSFSPLSAGRRERQPHFPERNLSLVPTPPGGRGPLELVGALGSQPSKGVPLGLRVRLIPQDLRRVGGWMDTG